MVQIPRAADAAIFMVRTGLAWAERLTLLAFDDTDSLGGGCTTHLAWRLAASLPPGVDLLGPPRLVRLNPNVPHKTRGNGALALRLGRGRGRHAWAGRADGRDLVSFAEGDPLDPAQADRVWRIAERLIEAEAHAHADNTHPALVLAEGVVPESFYRAAVSRYVSTREATKALVGAGARWRTWKDPRGLRGAAGAASWPMRRGTYELLTYRDRRRWGTVRDVTPALGAALDAVPGTFDNWDPETDHLRAAPAGPDPILVGVRGTDSAALRSALDLIGPERPDGALLVATNQGTDDHAVARDVRDLAPFSCATLEGRIAAAPVVWRGGHVFARFADATGQVDLAAYEPTGPVTATLATLDVGDRVRVQGGVHDDASLFALERLEILGSAIRQIREAPRCDDCRRSMKSRGRGELYACEGCGRRAPAVLREQSGPAAGVVDAPTRVRRHLCRPPGLAGLVEWPADANQPAKLYQVAAA